MALYDEYGPTIATERPSREAEEAAEKAAAVEAAARAEEAAKEAAKVAAQGARGEDGLSWLGDVPFACDRCGRKYLTKGDLYKHQMATAGKAYHCPKGD